MAGVDSALRLSVEPVERPLNLIPVGLKEAALDSPTFRATSVHTSEQVELVERWLESFVKATSRLAAEVSQLETIVHGFVAQCTPPPGIGEAAIDHDYALLAMKEFGEGVREVWSHQLKSVKKYDIAVVDPIRSFLSGELRAFKETRRILDTAQKGLDSSLSRYLGQSKVKEASSLREDAFQVHEARKAYLKASLDFSVAGPQLKDGLDKLLVRIFTDQWREIRISRDASHGMLSKLGTEMERVRGWSREMENSERAFKRELMEARKQIEDNASQMIKPSRELADYETSTVPFLGTGAKMTAKSSGVNKLPVPERDEKQGWLFMKTTVGKPARTVWTRRWFFVKNGIFGWLVQGVRAGGVEESEKIGVLLCGVKPAFQEERRFCWEVKTKDTSIILQAETQTELSEWISAFEVVKKKALDDPTSVESSPLSPGVDPAFAITPPVSPDFAVKHPDGSLEQRLDDASGSLAVPDREGPNVATRVSVDIGFAAKRVTSLEKDSEGSSSRDHAARIIQKLDLHKRGSATPNHASQATTPTSGIASLISASHSLLPLSPGMLPHSAVTESSKGIGPSVPPPSSLAPSTMANPPAPTNLSHTAVLVSSERGLGIGGRTDGSGMPGGIMANLWGSSNWGYVNRLAGDLRHEQQHGAPQAVDPPLAGSIDDVGVMDGSNDPQSKGEETVLGNIESLNAVRHRKTMSATMEGSIPHPSHNTSLLEAVNEYPNNYPPALKAQHAQFRVLFPTVARHEKLVLVFRATWNPNEQQEFPGRVYVTEKEIYFYSHYLGLVLNTGVALNTVSEVTAALGRDCDFLYLLLKQSGREEERRRITISVFLDSLRLTQRRLAFLVENANSPEPLALDEVIKKLLKLEVEKIKRSSSADSWEDLTYHHDDNDVQDESSPDRRRQKNIKASVRIDGTLFGEAAKTGREVQKFQLPRRAVEYAPHGMQESTRREFNVSAKALFYVMFGDKSIVFQLLYSNRWADRLVQTPWVKQGTAADSRWTRQFSSQGNATPMADTQTIEVMNDHLCYVVTHHKQPWRLPYSQRFVITTKLVITHSAKSKSRLAIFQKVMWQKKPTLPYLKGLVEKEALNSLEADALDLTTVAMDQVAKLGSQSKTNKAIEIFGNIGSQFALTQLDASAGPNLGGTAPGARIKARKPVNMMNLVFADIAVRIARFLGATLDIAFAISKKALGLFTTHTVLVVLLLMSVLYNSWFGYRDGLEWWHERNAGNYMARLGVKPSPMISRAVYLNDVEEMFHSNLDNHTLNALSINGLEQETPRTCRVTFGELLTASSATPDMSRRAGRFHRSRDVFARYRHDLMVAMRVVNRVERDFIDAEWEDWVRGEDRNCARVENMLHNRKRKSKREKPSSSSSSSSSPASASSLMKDAERIKLDGELGPEFAAYCASCRDELRQIGDGIRLI